MGPGRRELSYPLADGRSLQRLLQEELERGGLFVPTPDPPEPGQRVLVRLLVGPRQLPLEFEGLVVHAASAKEAGALGPGAGLLLQGAARAILAARRVLQELGEPPPPDPSPQEAGERLPGRRRDPSPLPPPEVIRPPRPASATSPSQPAAVREPPGARAGRTRAVASRTKTSAGPEHTSGSLDTRVDAFLERVQGADHYRTLGVARGVGADEIRRTFFALAREFHPDAHFQRTAPEVVERLEQAYQKICDAYQVLANPEKRLQYDLTIGNTGRAQGEPEHLSRKRLADQIAGRFKDRHAEQIGRAQNLIQRARAANQAGDLGGARTALRLALTFDPFSTEARKLLAALDEEVGPGAERRPAGGLPAGFRLAGSRRRGLSPAAGPASPPAPPAPPAPRGRGAGGRAAGATPVRSATPARPGPPAPTGRAVTAAPPTARVETLLRAVRQALQDGDRGFAATLLDQVLLLDPEHPEAAKLRERIASEDH
ncbi:MAG: DnaJ domain-containing protein [Myxococcota bacterium]|jgi:DnaJ-domain-containing protein 1|nr:DnaJ domain-containing protein [Myxococcota bacterium]